MANQLKIMILSGVREQGKDMFAVQVNDEIFVLDAGLKYPDSSLFGIDVVIPDMDFFEQYGDRVAGIFITHGHAYYVSLDPEYIFQEGQARKADIVMYGHTHKPFFEQKNGITVLNPGSLSFPRQEGRKGSYMLMEISPDGSLTYDQRYLG